MNLIGTQVKFLGSFWEGRMTAEEKATEYLCTVLDWSTCARCLTFSIAHRMQPGAPPMLADPNLNPAHLAVLVRIGFNKKAFEPAVAAIKEKYYELFRGKGGEHKEGSSGAAGAASSSAAGGAAGAASSSDAADVAS